MSAKFKLPHWVLPVIIALPMLAGANGGGSKNVSTSAAREAFQAGNYELMYSELENLKRNLGQDTLRLKYADALLLQSQAGHRIDMVYVTPALLKKVRSADYLYEGFPASERDGKFRNFCHPSDHYPALVRLKL